MCLLRETGEEDGLLGQGVLKMCIETADAGLDLYLPFFIYEEYMVNMVIICGQKYFWKSTEKTDKIRPWQCQS